MTGAEVAANALNAVSIVLAGRNSVHTWWTGIAGCLVFGGVFFETRLYADATLQGFFVATSVVGWVHWRARPSGTLRVRRTAAPSVALLFGAALGVTATYAWLLHAFTDAYAPVPDSAVLAFSVLGQLLLMKRRVESWWCWIVVNTLAVPLYVSRELYLTATLYAGFWVNALLSLRHWNQLAEPAQAEDPVSP
jgi:nicotinamide mononucleotide transporter